MEQNSETRIETILVANGNRKPTRTKPATIRVDEIARVLRIGRLRVYSLLESRVIPGVRLGSRGRWLVSRAAFESWLQSAGNAPGREVA